MLPKGFHRIRHYGLFAGTKRTANLAQARELLDVPTPTPHPAEAGRARRATASSEPVSLLPLADDRDRDLQPWPDTETQTITVVGPNPDRYVMIEMMPTPNPTDARQRPRPPGNEPGCAGLTESRAGTPFNHQERRRSAWNSLAGCRPGPTLAPLQRPSPAYLDPGNQRKSP